MKTICEKGLTGHYTNHSGNPTKLLDNHRKSQQYIDLLQNKLKVDFTKLFMPIILEIILKCIKSVRLHVQLLYFFITPIFNILFLIQFLFDLSPFSYTSKIDS
jgi:uncharacterized membrane protein YfhO